MSSAALSLSLKFLSLYRQSPTCHPELQVYLRSKQDTYKLNSKGIVSLRIYCVLLKERLLQKIRNGRQAKNHYAYLHDLFKLN